MKKNRCLLVALLAAFVCVFTGCSARAPMDGLEGAYYPDSEICTGDSFNEMEEQGFVSAAETPDSAFSLSVSTSAYTVARRYIENGQRIPTDAVRIEEFINYFRYDLASPQVDTFAAYTNVYDCPWQTENKLLRVTLKAKEINREAVGSNLVFLIDTSGSMHGSDRLELVKESMRFMAEGLTASDTVSIVTYASKSKVLLKGESGANTNTILRATDALQAKGATAGGAGISTAFSIAKDYYIEGGNNRVIMISDGDFNVGVSSGTGLIDLINRYREYGVYFTAMGVGMGNYRDNFMENLTRHGNGQAFYLDSREEARRVFTKELMGMLFTVADDAKAQVVFNPDRVQSYRLLGYENRRLSAEEFDDETTDAGEIGSGHTVTALYEIVPTDAAEGVYATAQVRYRDAGQTENKTFTKTIDEAAANTDDRFIACVAEYALILRDSAYRGNASLSAVAVRLQALQLADDDRVGFAALINQAKHLYE